MIEALIKTLGNIGIYVILIVLMGFTFGLIG
jgi:hypothetical protein